MDWAHSLLASDAFQALSVSHHGGLETFDTKVSLLRL